MPTAVPVVVSGVVEGLVDEVVLRRVVTHAGATTGSVYGRNGKAAVRQRIAGYNQAANHAPWMVMIDLNHEASCPPELLTAWLPNPARWMCFRVAVREIEAWLIGDREHLAAFLGVNISRVPLDPEKLDDPKGEMVKLAKASRRKDVRNDMVPRHGSGRIVGPAYTSRLIEFVSDTRAWRPVVAAKNCDSLARCLRGLRRLVVSQRVVR